MAALVVSLRFVILPLLGAQMALYPAFQSAVWQALLQSVSYEVRRRQSVRAAYENKLACPDAVRVKSITYIYGHDNEHNTRACRIVVGSENRV